MCTQTAKDEDAKPMTPVDLRKLLIRFTGEVRVVSGTRHPLLPKLPAKEAELTNLRGIYDDGTASWIVFIEREVSEIIAGNRNAMQRFCEQSEVMMYPWTVPADDPAESTIEAPFDEPVLYQPKESQRKKAERKQAVARSEVKVRQAKKTYGEILDTWKKLFGRRPPPQGHVDFEADGESEDDAGDVSSLGTNLGSHGNETASHKSDTDGELNGSQSDSLKRDASGQLDSKRDSGSSWVLVPSREV
jgi:hypothetical protein